MSTLNPQRIQTLNFVLDGLMRRYKERVPDVQGILDAMVDEGIIASQQDIQNDHIAFRTMGVPQLGIRSFERIFLHYGYEKRDAYFFEGKRLDAFWYAPPSPEYPRIFISELRVEDMSPSTQTLIRRFTDKVTHDPVDDLDLDNADAVDGFLHRALWDLPTWEEYEQLAQESEYAAWVLNNRYYLNHFTISVHTLPEGYSTVAQFNAFLERKGFKLNDSGGKMKQSPDGLLLQSSTVARMVDATFQDAQGNVIKRPVSGSYVEFAERRPLPEFAHLPHGELQRHHRREGFEAGNADKIFESTYSSQTQKHVK